jgi:hypothetical protein
MADFLSVDQAVAELTPATEQNPAPEATAVETQTPETVETEIEGETTPEEAQAAEQPSEGETQEQDDPEPPAIEMPRSWSAADRDTWNGIPREAQEKILARETDRDAATQKAVQEASAARKAAQEEAERAIQLRTATEQALGQAANAFKDKWSGIDWQRLARENPAEYNVYWPQYQQEQVQLATLQAAQNAQAHEAFQAFQRQRAEQLPQYAPALADPIKGREEMAKVEAYAAQYGVPADRLQTADALLMGVVWKAMKYDEAQTSAHKLKPAKTQPAVTPAASAKVIASPQRAKAAAFARLSKTGSIDDAVAFLNG